MSEFNADDLNSYRDWKDLFDAFYNLENLQALWMQHPKILNLDPSIFAYVPLATPENLARDLATQVDDLPPENVGGFINVCLLAAVTGRRTVVEDYLKKPKWSALVWFIRKHFFHKANDRLTFSQLNLIGLCILAVSGETTDAFANANFRSTRALVSDFRLRLGGAKSIWDADIGASRFSKERKRILKEQKKKFSAQSVAENGAAVVKILNDKYQSGIKA